MFYGAIFGRVLFRLTERVDMELDGILLIKQYIEELFDSLAEQRMGNFGWSQEEVVEVYSLEGKVLLVYVRQPEGAQGLSSSLALLSFEDDAIPGSVYVWSGATDEIVAMVVDTFDFMQLSSSFPEEKESEKGNGL